MLFHNQKALVRTRILAVLTGLLAMSLSAGCSNAPNVSQPRELPVVAFHSTTSFDDRGLKAIIFPEGVAFVMRVDMDSGTSPDFFTMRRASLPRADQKALVEVMERHHVFDLPRAMRSTATDGSEVYVLCADAHREHWVYGYASRNPDFLAFTTAFMDVVSRSVAQAENLTATEFLEGIAADIEKLPKDSLARNTAATWLDHLVRHGPAAFRHVSDMTRFTVPGDGVRWLRDVAWEDVKHFREETEPARSTAREAPIVVDDPLLDLGPTGADVPLLER